MDQIYLQTKAVVEELGEKAGLKAGQILVVGCSTSEVLGAKIGSNSSPEVAKYIFRLCRSIPQKPACISPSSVVNI